MVRDYEDHVLKVKALHCVEHSQAIACFTNIGDSFYVKDRKKDGKAAVGLWELNDGSRSGACVNRQGAGAWVQCNKNLPESKATFIDAGVWNGGAKTRARLTVTKNGCLFNIDNAGFSPCKLFG